jgi:hypothetical protein
MGRQTGEMVFQALLLAVRAGSLLAAARFGLSALQAIALFSGAGCVAWCLYAWWLLGFSSRSRYGVMWTSIRELGVMLLVLTPTVAAKLWLASNIWTCVALLLNLPVVGIVALRRRRAFEPAAPTMEEEHE